MNLEKPNKGKAVPHKPILFKEISLFLKHLDAIDLKRKQFLLVSGQDANCGLLAVKNLQKRLKNELESFEQIIFSDESEEGKRLLEELDNAPLFSPYRFLLVHQSEKIFQNLLSDSIQKKIFQDSLAKLPENTLLLLLYSGTPLKSFLNLFQDQTCFAHLQTGKLYPNQLEAALHRALSRRKLKLSREAFCYLAEKIDAKTGSVEHIAEQIQLRAGSKKEEIKIDLVHSLLSPAQGWDVFALTEALFAGNFQKVLREYKLFHSSTDNLFALLKIILKHIDEIRLARICYMQQTGEKELLSILGIEKRHPFVQKKILERLQGEALRFDSKKQLEVYNFLITMQKSFLSQVPLSRQFLFFQAESLKIFSK